VKVYEDTVFLELRRGPLVLLFISVLGTFITIHDVLYRFVEVLS